LTKSGKEGGNGELNPSLPVSTTTDDDRTSGGGAGGSRARDVQHAHILFDKTTTATATATALLGNIKKEELKPPCPWPPPPPSLCMCMCICVCDVRARTAAKAEDNELNNTGAGKDEELGDDGGWTLGGGERVVEVVRCFLIRPSPLLSQSSHAFAVFREIRCSSRFQIRGGWKKRQRQGGGKGEFNDTTKYPFRNLKREES